MGSPLPRIVTSRVAGPARTISCRVSDDCATADSTTPQVMVASTTSATFIPVLTFTSFRPAFLSTRFYRGKEAMRSFRRGPLGSRGDYPIKSPVLPSFTYGEACTYCADWNSCACATPLKHGTCKMVFQCDSHTLPPSFQSMNSVEIEG
jgi:hypothetical protein